MSAPPAVAGHALFGVKQGAVAARANWQKRRRLKPRFGSDRIT
jgi:hypothetical protein